MRASIRILGLALAATLVTACEEKPEGAKPTASSPGGQDASTKEGPFDLEVEQYRLANGLNVILHVDRKLPAVNVNLWYHVGSKNEEPGRTGFAHLFEHVMFQGSQNVKGEYITLIEQAGASLDNGGVNGTTDYDRTNYFQTVPSTSLEYALWLESDRMGFLLPTLDQKSFDNQRDVVKNEKRQGDNRPYAASRYLIPKHMYPANHPYSHAPIGSMEDLEAASLEDVRAFFRKYYAPNNASLALVGNFEKDVAKRLVQKYFGPIPPGPVIERPKAIIPKLERTIQVVQEERAPQPVLSLTWHAPAYFDPEEPALDFAAQILGEGKGSRLYKKLVRDEKLASQVYAAHTGREIAGLFTIEVMALPGASLDKIRELVLAEIAALAKDGPTDSELARRKASHEYQFLTSLERIGGFGGKADRLNRYYTYLGRADAFQEDFERYQKVDGDQIRASLTKWVAEAHHLDLRFVPTTAGRPDVPDFDRSQAPSMAGQIPFETPTVQEKELPNGLKLYVHSRDDVPKVEVALIFFRGDLNETEANAGLTYMTVACVDEGTRSRTALEIEAALDELGSTLTTEGDKFGAALGLSALKRNLAPSLAIMADVALNPTFPESEVELVKKLRLEQIVSTKNNPSALATDLFPKILFAGTAGIPPAGTAESIQALKREDMIQTHKTFFRPNNAALLFVGDVTVEEAEKLALEHFGSWEKGELPTVELKSPPAPGRTYVFLVDTPDAPQSQIRIGSVAPPRTHPDFLPIHVMNGIFGGTFSSRLNLNLREDKGWSYGAFSSFQMRRDYGYWVAQAGVHTQMTAPALLEFKKEIERLGSTSLSADELNGTKKTLSRSYLQNFETLNQTVRQIAPLISNGVSLDYLRSYIPGVLSQTPDSIKATADKHLRFGNSIVLVLGDLKSIEKPIVDLDLGEVLVLNRDGKLLRKAGEGAAKNPG